MVLGAQIGQMVGLQFGNFLGRQIALGACREDRDDDIERRPFVPRIPSHAMPAAVDLRPWMTPVEDQGALGSCTSNALVGALEYLVRRVKNQHVDLSRLYVYFNQRLWDDCVRDDVGAAVSDGIRVLSRVGVPREVSWPYVRDLFGVQPPEPVYREAMNFRATDWWNLPVDGDALRGCLAAGFPVTFGTRVTESFVQTPRSGLCGMPQGADDRKHGRHALLLVGYDDRHRLFVVRNSWGSDWGDNGYVYMPYDYVLNREWTSGCWAVRMMAGDTFDPHQHAAVDVRQAPKAPPSGGGIGGTATQLAGGVVGTGAGALVGAVTGSGLLAGLAGGIVQGVTPGVASMFGGKDRGAFMDRDMSEQILAALRAQPLPQGHAYLPWDDGLDEHAAVRGITQSAHVQGAMHAPAPSHHAPAHGDARMSNAQHAGPPGGMGVPSVAGAAGAAGLGGLIQNVVGGAAPAQGGMSGLIQNVVGGAAPQGGMGGLIQNVVGGAQGAQPAPSPQASGGIGGFIRDVVGPDGQGTPIGSTPNRGGGIVQNVVGALDPAQANTNAPGIYGVVSVGAAAAAVAGGMFLEQKLPPAGVVTAGPLPPRAAQPAAPQFDQVLIDKMPEHIASWWRRDGGVKSMQGAPITHPEPMMEGAYRGTWVRFTDGAMFSWDPPPGAPRLEPITLLAREPTYTKWLELGGGKSGVGWPVAKIEDGPDRRGRLLKCTRGSIVDHPEHGAHPIFGAIFGYWLQLGGLHSDLGYPVADLEVPPDPTAAHTLRFQNGTLTWSPAGGVRRG
jgi:hypothetical protein